MQERFLNDREAPEVVPISTAALRKRRLLRQPPRFLKIGCKVIYRESDLLEFLRQCEQRPQLETR